MKTIEPGDRLTRRHFLALAGAGAAAVALAACGGSSAPASSAGSAASPAGAAGGAKSSALQALISAANKEGKVNWADVAAPEIVSGIAKKFNERFSTNIQVQLVPMRSTETETRLRQETAANKVTVDVVHPDSALVFSLLDDKVDALEQFDWVGTFGDVLPDIRKVVERAPQGLNGYALEYMHLVRAVLYNSSLVSASDVPKSWDDLNNPRWSGKKLVLDPQGAGTFQLVAKWDSAKVLDYSKQLGALDPLWQGSGPTIAKAVATGEALIAIATMSNVLDQPNKPIKVAHTEFYPGVQQMIFPVKHSPNINAARLFAAWMAVEGMQVSTDLGQASMRAWPDSGSWMAQQISELGGELAMLTTKDQLKAAEQVRAQIVNEYKKLGAK